MRAAEHTPRGPFSVIECLNDLAEIVEGGARLDRDRDGLLGRPEADLNRRSAMEALGNGFDEVNCHSEWLKILETTLDNHRRFGAADSTLLQTKCNLAVCYSGLGRNEEALKVRREVYARTVALRLSLPDEQVFVSSLNLAISLGHTGRYKEAKSFLREQLPAARRAFGEDGYMFLEFRSLYAEITLRDRSSTLDDFDEAELIVEDVVRRCQRVMGAVHPTTQTNKRLLHALKKIYALNLERSSRA